jgi:apolipoprotein N-acyltransferase
MNYARLRAIETRTWVARSANTGISCFIDPYGRMINPQPYDTQAAIKLSVPRENKKTFFVKNGDILSKIMIGISVLMLVWVVVQKVKRRIVRRET